MEGPAGAGSASAMWGEGVMAVGVMATEAISGVVARVVGSVARTGAG